MHVYRLIAAGDSRPWTSPCPGRAAPRPGSAATTSPSTSTARAAAGHP